MKISSKTRSVPELTAAIDAGMKLKYIYFWGHTPRRAGELDQSCFSQWFESAFELNGHTYPTAEHYMMAQKAALFGDTENFEKVLKAKTPGEAKAIGRQVRSFSEAKWLEARFGIVTDACVAKFSSTAELRSYLIQTGERVLVEASPVDKIWGVGLDANTARDTHPKKWRGLNLLGFALMEARHRLMASGQ